MLFVSTPPAFFQRSNPRALSLFTVDTHRSDIFQIDVKIPNNNRVLS